MKEKKVINLEMIKVLQREIERVCQRPMHGPRDFEWLSEQLELMGERLSPTTLKRCWHYLPDEVKTRPHTLDVLAQFLGYHSFDHFSTSRDIENSSPSNPVIGATLTPTSDLRINERVMLTWQPGRVCVIRHLGKGQFVVESAERTRLQPGNTFHCGLIIEGEQLYLNKLVQEDQRPRTYCCGMRNGVHFQVLGREKKEKSGKKGEATEQSGK